MEDLSTFRHPTLFLSSTDADTQNLEMLLCWGWGCRTFMDAVFGYHCYVAYIALQS